MDVLLELTKILLMPAVSAAVVCIVIVTTLRSNIADMRKDHESLALKIEQVIAGNRAHQIEDVEEFRMVRREFGETVMALRRKIEEVEAKGMLEAIFNRDTFLRMDLFHIDMKEIKEWLLRIETKLDTKT